MAEEALKPSGSPADVEVAPGRTSLDPGRRAAEARAAIGRSLEGVADELEQAADEAGREVSERVGRRLTESLQALIRELEESAREQDERLERRVAQLGSRLHAASDEAVAAINAAQLQALEQIDAAIERLTAKDRRQELRILRAERSAQIEEAIKRLEERGDALRVGLEATAGRLLAELAEGGAARPTEED